MYPLLKKYVESLAIAYVGLRILENAFYILGVVSLIVLLTLSKEYTGLINASYQPLSSIIIALHDWALLIGTVIIFGIGGITLNYVLYQSKLIPRWLSAWGLIGAAFVLLYGFVGMYKLDPNMISSILTVLALPIAVQEMVFAVWLIIKGFNPEIIKISKHLLQ